ncbi:hypothetical protein [Roseibium sp.]
MKRDGEFEYYHKSLPLKPFDAAAHAVSLSSGKTIARISIASAR